MCCTLAPVPVVLSPKSHAYETIVPSGSVDVEVKVTVWYGHARGEVRHGRDVRRRIDHRDARVTVAVPPRSSVTVSVTL